MADPVARASPGKQHARKPAAHAQAYGGVQDNLHDMGESLIAEALAFRDSVSFT